jgi:hypothetical protein
MESLEERGHITDNKQRRYLCQQKSKDLMFRSAEIIRKIFKENEKNKKRRVP